MRQQIGVALVLALLAITISVKDSAPLLAGGGRPPVTLSLPSSTTVNPGDTFTLPISLDMEADSHAISIVTLVLAFDPTVLKIMDFSPAGVLPDVLESSLGTDTAGLTAGSGMNPVAAIKSSTTVATITFQAVGSGGAATPIRFTRAEAYSLSGWDEASENVVGSTTDASITISGQAKPPSCPTPTVTVNFSWGNFGDTITVQGGGWLPGGSVTITATGPTQFDLGSVPVPDSGAWSGNITVPEVPTGNYELVFRENHEGCELVATDPFIIVAQAATLDPTEGPPGTEATVTGSGWPPGHKIAVKWRGTTLAETRADDHGNIQVFFFVPVDAAAGEHEIDIKDAEPGMGGIDDHLTFTVTGPAVTVERALTGAPDNPEWTSAHEETTFHPGDTIWYTAIVQNPGPPIDAYFTWQGKHADPEIGVEIFFDKNTVTLQTGSVWYYSPGTIPNDAPPGTYLNRVTVTVDGQEFVRESQFEVISGETNLIANAGPDQTVSGPSPVAVQLDGSGSTGDIVRYLWYNQYGELRAEGATPVIEVSFGKDNPQPGTQRTFILVVEDSQGNTAQDEVTITLGEGEETQPPEAEPTITANAGPDQTVPGPSPVAVQFDGSGSTGDIVSYKWYNQYGLLLAEGATPVIEVNFGHTDPQPGTTRTFTLVVEDSQGNTAQDQVTITLGEG
jgi:hypothetical protein